MGSRYGSSYDEATRQLLRRAFMEAWSVLKARRPVGSWEGELDLRSDLAGRLMELVDEGVTEPVELVMEAIVPLLQDQG